MQVKKWLGAIGPLPPATTCRRLECCPPPAMPTTSWLSSTRACGYAACLCTCERTPQCAAPVLNALSGEYAVKTASLWQRSNHTVAGVRSYVGDELAAVGHYFCALAVAQPFLVARDNLLLLFEQNRIRWRAFCGAK